MELLYTKGDLLDGSHEVIVNPVNCVGVMGAGVAKQIKAKYPNTYKLYLEHCTQNLMYHMPIIVKEDGIYIANIATKDHWRQDSDLEIIKNQLVKLSELMVSNGLTEVSMPRIGCGLGNLSWEKVEPLIIEAFNDTNVVIKVVDFEKRNKKEFVDEELTR